MTQRLVSPGHHQPWYWQCKKCVYSSYPWEWISTICNISMSKNDVKCIFFFFFQKNFALQRLNNNWAWAIINTAITILKAIILSYDLIISHMISNFISDVHVLYDIGDRYFFIIGTSRKESFWPWRPSKGWAPRSWLTMTSIVALTFLDLELAARIGLCSGDISY